MATMTFKANVYINQTTDVGGTTAPTNAPFVIGDSAGQHLEFDGNEILSKSNGTTPSILYLQDGAGDTRVCGTEGLTLTSGLLKITKNSNTTTIGSQNSNFCHIYNSTSIPFIFNNSVLTTSGDLGSSTYPFSKIYLHSTLGQIQRAGISKSWYNGREGAIIRQTSYTGYNPILSCKTTNGSWELGPYSSDYLYFVYNSDTGYNSGTNTSGEYKNTVRLSSTGVLYGACWNDYAEYRITKEKIEPGRCIIETGNDDLILSTKRMQPGAEIVSDTFGFAIGETEDAKTPIASNGRVLAYPYEDIEEFRKNIGRPVCSGPNGTVSIMTDEEYQKYGYCTIGTISAIPDYEEWGTGKVKVNGRIWIRIR